MASTRSAPLCFAARCLHRLRTLQHGTECGRLPASRRGEGKPGLFTLFHTCSTVRFLDNPLPLPPDRLRLQDSPGFAVLLNRPRPCREALVLGTACSSCNSGTLPRRPTSRPRSSPRSAPRSPGRTGRGAQSRVTRASTRGFQLVHVAKHWTPRRTCSPFGVLPVRRVLLRSCCASQGFRIESPGVEIKQLFRPLPVLGVRFVAGKAG